MAIQPSNLLSFEIYKKKGIFISDHLSPGPNQAKFRYTGLWSCAFPEDLLTGLFANWNAQPSKIWISQSS